MSFSFNGIEFENDKKKVKRNARLENINKTNYKKLYQSNHSEFRNTNWYVIILQELTDDTKLCDEWLVEYRFKPFYNRGSIKAFIFTLNTTRH
jgi:hypothetical protein